MDVSGYAVHIVEDDLAVRDGLGLLLGLKGFRVIMFADAESFLLAYRPEWRGCLLLDIRMPGMDGLTLQRKLREKVCQMPAIIMTGHGDVHSAREAFRAHAVDFLEKPIDYDKLLTAIGEAFAMQQAALLKSASQAGVTQILESLTPREREVMELVVAGRHNREIAIILGISARTVEVHKARMMDKLHVEAVPGLVRLSMGKEP